MAGRWLTLFVRVRLGLFVAVGIAVVAGIAEVMAMRELLTWERDEVRRGALSAHQAHEDPAFWGTDSA
ncbi:hypothetical protein [Streptomyces noursei]|uniref:hypothetical protein n=1 Tax=Streptomyces noursei TaxID=1971 RepID=UPI003DA2B908